MSQTITPTPEPVDYSAVDASVQKIINRAKEYIPAQISRETIEQEILHAYNYAKAAHEGQTRHSGEPYISHPVAATTELLCIKADLVSIQACLLHDVAEDTDKTIKDIADEFGQEVAHISSGMEKLSKLKYRGEERSVESLRKMFIAVSEDVRVILVKLADRTHNMKTLLHHPNKEKRDRIALETLNIYAPIADRLGIYYFKEALETECFKVLHPEEHSELQKELALFATEQELFCSNIQQVIREIIPEQVPILEVSYRVKSPYSIYKKLNKKEDSYASVRDLYDLFALRIITDTPHHCYEILGEIHTKFKPIPGRFKDYIAIPKQNGYQSLHTAVLGVFQELGQPVEIQIRTKQMHEQAEIGIAAHFEYSEKGRSGIANDTSWVAKIKEVVQESQNSEFLADMKMEVFGDTVFVFTPNGEIKTLPRKSTPIDFAYSVHSDLGNHIAIAKVNGRVVPLSHELSNGDKVEVIVDKNKSPSITWLSFVKTTQAKKNIKNYVNQLNREELIEKGKFILNTYLHKMLWKTLDKDLSILKNIDGRILGTKDKEDLLVQIGNLSRKPSTLLHNFVSDSVRRSMHQAKLAAQGHEAVEGEGESAPNTTSLSGEIVIGGQRQIPYRFAQCCTPKVGDKIVAYSTKTQINVHKTECETLQKANIDRLMPAHWYGQELKGITIRLELVFSDRMGVLRDLTAVFFHMNLNTEELSVSRNGYGDALINVTLTSKEEDYYLADRLLDYLKTKMNEYKEGKIISVQ